MVMPVTNLIAQRPEREADRVLHRQQVVAVGEQPLVVPRPTLIVSPVMKLSDVVLMQDGVDEGPEDQPDHDQHHRQHERVARSSSRARGCAFSRRERGAAARPLGDGRELDRAGSSMALSPEVGALRRSEDAAARRVRPRPTQAADSRTDTERAARAALAVGHVLRLHDAAFFEDVDDLLVGVLDGIRRASCGRRSRCPPICSSTPWARMASIAGVRVGRPGRAEERVGRRSTCSLMIAKFGSAASSSSVHRFS